MNEQSAKLMELALNPAAHDGEWQAAFRKIRGRASCVEELIDLLAEPSESMDVTPNIPFGKYKGHTVMEVWRNDPGYLQWMIDSCRNLPDWLTVSIRNVTGLTPKHP